MPADQPLIDRIRADLAAAGDADRAVQQQTYMKSALPFHGIASPALKVLLRPHLRGYRPADRTDWSDTVRALWDGASHREEWYAALAIARHRIASPWRDLASLDLWRHLVVTGAWWDVVDETAGHLVGEVLLHHHDVTAPSMRAWALDDDLWVRRTAVLAQHRHKSDTDTDLLAEVIVANLDDTSFWLRKAIGWALREHGYVDPGWVRRFVAEHADRLSPLSRREALKRIGP